MLDAFGLLVFGDLCICAILCFDLAVCIVRVEAEFVAKPQPDGYTFFFGANGPILFSPLIFTRSAYDWKKDFAPVSSVSFTPLVLHVHPATPYKTVGDVLAAGKIAGNSLTMASPGAGTTNHLASEYLQQLSGAKWSTVHYKGNAPATTDLLGGQVAFNFAGRRGARQLA